METTTRDKYNNQVKVEGEAVETYAVRQQLEASEDVSDRDQQTQRFRYFFDPGVVIDGRSRLRDAGQTLKIIGEPDTPVDSLRVHHIEAIAEVVNG